MKMKCLLSVVYIIIWLPQHEVEHILAQLVVAIQVASLHKHDAVLRRLRCLQDLDARVDEWIDLELVRVFEHLQGVVCVHCLFPAHRLVDPVEDGPQLLARDGSQRELPR